MKAISQVNITTANQLAQTTAGTVKEIDCETCVVRILKEQGMRLTFEIDDSMNKGERDPFFTYGPFEIPNRPEFLDRVTDCVSSPWTVKEVEALIENLWEEEREINEEYLRELALNRRQRDNE